jgi:hypothetical protein
MSIPYFLQFDLPVNHGVADYTWRHLTVGRKISISAVAVMIEYPASFAHRTATIELVPVEKDLAKFLSAGGTVIDDADIHNDARVNNSGDVWEGCRCVPPIESTCDQCPPPDADGHHHHPQKAIDIALAGVNLFQFRLKLDGLGPSVNVRGKVAIIYDAD